MSNGDKLEELRRNAITVTLKKLEIIQRHKDNVQDACNLLGRRLIERAKNEGEIEFAIQLIIQGYLHDLSKFDLFERDFLIGNEDKETLKLAIYKHQASNKHHVEFWKSVDNMPRLFLAELVCDLYARSAEMGTNLRDFIKDTLVPQYEISTSGKAYKTIKEFVDVILENEFVKLKG